MGHYQKPILVMFLGVPGSGKTYFASQAAKKINAIRLNSDAMRLSIFGSHENILATYESKDRKTVNSYVFNAIDYATKQILSTGVDVFYDANSNTRKDRLGNEAIASHVGAVQRGQDRENTAESRKKTADEMHAIIDRMNANIQEPDSSEYVIDIDGLIPFEEQFVQFEAQLKALIS
jgi:predicted kinase